MHFLGENKISTHFAAHLPSCATLSRIRAAAICSQTQARQSPFNHI